MIIPLNPFVIRGFNPQPDPPKVLGSTVPLFGALVLDRRSA